MDRESHALANALAGLPEDSPCLEVIGGSIELECQEDGIVALVGAETICVDADVSQARFAVSTGERLSLRLGRRGFTFYVAFKSGTDRCSRLAETPTSLESRPIRVVTGPQRNLFPADALRRPLTVTNELSRAGVLLTGALSPHTIELRSEPACPGTIQVTPNGTAIVLGPDGPTIGGYPKIAVVCSADLDRIGQLRPGDSIDLTEITLDQARDALHQHEEALRKRLDQMRWAS